MTAVAQQSYKFGSASGGRATAAVSGTRSGCFIGIANIIAAVAGAGSGAAGTAAKSLRPSADRISYAICSDKVFAFSDIGAAI